MTYLDYSATTNVDEKVLKCFEDNFFINKNDFNEEEASIKKNLNTDKEVIFTSGSTESNNMAIMGIANKYKKGHIITTKLEHSSVEECLKDLERKGFIIDYVNLINGVVDLNHLKSLICKDTIFVTIASVSSEIGILQPIDEIGKILKKHNIIFHSDMTQSIGKVKIELTNVDLISFGSHKIFGLKGAGALLKNKKIDLEKTLYGERTYNYALIKSFTYALELISKNIDSNYKYVKKLNEKIIERIKNYDKVAINSNDNSIPYIINLSIMNIKPEVFLHMLEVNNVYISTKSACSNSNDYSQAVYAATSDLEKAKHSIRISLSNKTSEKDINNFLNIFKNCYSNIIDI